MFLYLNINTSVHCMTLKLIVGSTYPTPLAPIYLLYLTGVHLALQLPIL